MVAVKTSFIKDAGLLFSGSVIAQAIGFFITPVLTRIYSPEEFGAVFLFTSIVSVCSVISGLRMEMAIVVEDDDERAEALAQLAILLNIISGIVFTLIILFFNEPIKALFNLSGTGWLYAVAPVISLSGILESLIIWYNRSRRYKRISANRITTSGSAALYKAIHPGTGWIPGNGLIIGHIIGQALGVIHLWYSSGLKLLSVNRTIVKKVFKDYRQFPIYSAPAALLNIIAVNVPIFMISSFDGEAATGFFGNAYKLTYLPMSLLAMAMSQVFYERIARLKHDMKESSKMAHDLFNFLAVLGVIPVVLIAVWGDLILPFILGDKWLLSGEMAAILILFYFSMFLTNPFASAFEVYQKLRHQLFYNFSFLCLTSGAMYFTYKSGSGTMDAIRAFAFVGLILRLSVLNYFFYLFGKSLWLKTAIVILGTGSLIWLGNFIRNINL